MSQTISFIATVQVHLEIPADEVALLGERRAILAHLDGIDHGEVITIDQETCAGCSRLPSRCNCQEEASSWTDDQPDESDLIDLEAA